MQSQWHSMQSLQTTKPIDFESRENIADSKDLVSYLERPECQYKCVEACTRGSEVPECNICGPINRERKALARKVKHIVRISFNFTALYGIDPQKQTFCGDLVLTYCWTADHADMPSIQNELKQKFSMDLPIFVKNKRSYEYLQRKYPILPEYNQSGSMCLKSEVLQDNDKSFPLLSHIWYPRVQLLNKTNDIHQVEEWASFVAKLGGYWPFQRWVDKGEQEIDLSRSIKEEDIPVLTKRFSSLVDQILEVKMSFNSKHSSRFSCKFDFHFFPFDAQDFQIRMQALEPNTVLLMDFDVSSSHIRRDVFFDQSFTLHYPYLLCLTSNRQVVSSLFNGNPMPCCVSHKLDSKSHSVYSQAVLIQRVQRNNRFYVLNIMLPLLAMSLVSFSSLAYFTDEEDITLNDRITVSLTLSLTAVAFKFVIQDDVPRIGYLTILDHYVLSCFLFILSFVAVHVLSQLVDSSEYQIMITMVVVWLLWHTYFVVSTFKISRRQKTALDITNCIWRKYLDHRNSNVLEPRQSALTHVNPYIV